MELMPQSRKKCIFGGGRKTSNQRRKEMKVLKKTDDYTVYQKRSGRYAVVGSDKKNINGEDKVKILIAEGIVKQELPKEPEPEVVEEATEEVAEEAAEETVAEEAPAEEAPAEEAPAEEESAAEEPAAEEEAPAEEEPETKE
jgi:hypothetical protein